jgi:hypothetical protein
MVAIGHNGLTTAGDTLELMKSCLSQEPSRPVLCGEACYEGHMQTNFQDVQRHLFWSFMLSGAAGHTYGAAGVWHASVEGDPGIDPVYDWTTWKEGMNYPGSTQVGLGKKLLERYPWWRFEAHPEWTEKDCFAAGIPGELRIIYLPRRNIYNWCAGPPSFGCFRAGPKSRNKGSLWYASRSHSRRASWSVTMPAKPSYPEILLPRGWPSRVINAG